MNGLRIMVGLFALSLIIFAAIPGIELITLAKMIAASFGVSLLFVLLYPQIRGVRKGDRVLVAKGAFPRLLGFSGTALRDARLGDEVPLKLRGGREAVGILQSYEGLFSPPYVEVVVERKEAVMQ